MQKTVALLILLLGVLVVHEARADANRDSLIEAWEAQITSLPGTARFESVGDDVYQIEDTDLPYEGTLTIVGALVRPNEVTGYDTGFTHIGMVDFRLADMSEDLLTSQVYYYWLNERQTLYYNEAEQRWVNTATFQASFADMYDVDSSFGALSFMLNYGIWVFLIALIIFVFVAVGKQTKKARTLMDDSAAINEKARANIDRAEGLQDELLAIARDSRDLNLESNVLLRQILDAVKK
ncbi:MAG: hypothetical protein ACR2QZ_11335 [Woeseiaceae bacterium]